MREEPTFELGLSGNSRLDLKCCCQKSTLQQQRQRTSIPPSWANPPNNHATVPHLKKLCSTSATPQLCCVRRRKALYPQERQRRELNPRRQCKDEGRLVGGRRQRVTSEKRYSTKNWIRQEGKGSYKSKKVSFRKLRIESTINCGRLATKTQWGSPEERLSNNPHKALKAYNTIMRFQMHQEQEFCLNVHTARRPSVMQVSGFLLGFFFFFPSE